MRSLGVCVGASTVSLVEVVRDASGTTVSRFRSIPHEGNVREVVRREVSAEAVNAPDRVAVTGRRFRRLLSLSQIPEPEAVELAYKFCCPPNVACGAVVSAGGETTMVYALDKQGLISSVRTGNKCASGTGDFFIQQTRRLGVTLDQASEFAGCEDPYRPAGRCSVFCKSDCTHATNKGVPKSSVVAGLGGMMADKVVELLGKIPMRNIMITGGVTRNRVVIENLRSRIEGLVVPEHAPHFEALGAALWACENETVPIPEDIFHQEAVSFKFLEPLSDFSDQVTFESMARGTARPGDRCLVGLDVGSTTTKAVLFRWDDNALLASIYLRTNGDPVGASRQCYAALAEQLAAQLGSEGGTVRITGLAVTGSGRQIASLHALTPATINEIIAHATAAAHFDREVDTIFEIGGQDAKYTYLTNSVPTDYAMNEACSAGTGSFLEEAARESLGVKTEEIADIAIAARRPPNFSDQCAAFISSDIKNAIHEGVPQADIVAGLVYSICMNYSNRVKGNRPVGAKVFMQGGVCYNRAVPLAMAALTGKRIIVPPEPGLMGAYGVALELKKRIEAGFIAEGSYDLDDLVAREATRESTFTCAGGGEKCDRGCEIAIIRVGDQKIPFGGACNKYYNQRHSINVKPADYDLVRTRQQLLNVDYASPDPVRSRGTVGISRSLLANSFLPLWRRFFTELGFKVLLSGPPNREGMDRCRAAFCYPVEIAHGMFHSLLSVGDMDYIFLPHVRALPITGGHHCSYACPLVQGETFYLPQAFRAELDGLRERRGTRIVQPLIDMADGYSGAEEGLVSAAAEMGVGRGAARKAFRRALEFQLAFEEERRKIGKAAIEELERDPGRIAVVLFGRPYNAFADEAHMGIPRKIASRGMTVIPFDCLPLADEADPREHMYWAMGKINLRAASFVERHPQLFGVWVSNFSCGPDSFVSGYFRRVMGRKPSLTLELDSHTADAGVETRVEAFLDIVQAYRQLHGGKSPEIRENTFRALKTVQRNGKMKVVSATGEEMPLTDSRVKVYFPSMGRFNSEGVAAGMRGAGIRAQPVSLPDEATLKLGRAHTTCKECLPLILTVGSLLQHAGNGRVPGEPLLYFMPTANGPCRFGQYSGFMQDLVRDLELQDVAILSLSSDSSYGGLGTDTTRRMWWGIMMGDMIEDLRSLLLANAVDRNRALALLEERWGEILRCLESGNIDTLADAAAETYRKLAALEGKRPWAQVPAISLVGEIYVRRDGISRQYITERLAEKGFATQCAHVVEWLRYCDWAVSNNLFGRKLDWRARFKHFLEEWVKNRDTRRLHATKGPLKGVLPDAASIPHIARASAPHISRDLPGEAVLTVGSALEEVVTRACGVIAIGPFGCMPNRLSEAILSETMTEDEKLKLVPAKDRERIRKIMDGNSLPFLAIESDGMPFPQVIEAKLEAFLLQSSRLHQSMMAHPPS